MLMPEYLDTLSEQIRCKKARPLVVEEIRNHIEDQTATYQKNGMDENTAMEKAVADMGDPVQTGVELDKIHRPKMQWSIIMIAATLSLFGLIMQIIIFHVGCLSNDSNVTAIRDGFIMNAVLSAIISMVIMIGICMIDYTFLGKHPLILWFSLCVFLIVNSICNTNFSYLKNYYYLTLLIPVFAAVVFCFRRHTVFGLIKCIGLAFLGLLCSGFGPVSSTIEYILCVMIILSVAILKEWFIPVSHPKAFVKKWFQLAMIWIPVIGFPVFLIFTALFYGDQTPLLAEYQVQRIKAIFGERTYDYTLYNIRDILTDASFFGTHTLPLTTLPAIHNNYIITCIVSYFGIGAAVLILLLIGIFLYKAFHISFLQKNQLGSIVSTACASALLLKSMIYVCANLGVAMPFSQMSMPFLSYGLKNAMVNAVLTGLLLSVFRNTDIISEKMIHPKYAFRLTIRKLDE